MPHAKQVGLYLATNAAPKIKTEDSIQLGMKTLANMKSSLVLQKAR